MTLNNELFRFLIVGIITVLLDFIFYYLILSINLFDHEIAKGVSFVIGLIFAFFANKKWTFRSFKKSIKEYWKFLLLYSFSLIINIFTNSFFLIILKFTIYKLAISFLIATICSATINYLGMKYFVFINKFK